LNFSVEGVLSSDLLALLDVAGIYVSASAACTTESSHPSHVLAAMGVPAELAVGTLRLSLGRTNREEEIPQITDSIAAAVHQLRKSQT
jgi:cysteine desulfurase